MVDKIRTPQQERAIATKSKIVNAGLELFSSSGYHKTSSKQIAKAAGVSIGIFYNYFKDKKDLFLTIVSINAGQIHKEVLDLFRNADWKRAEGREIIEKIITFSRDAHRINPDFHKEFNRMKDEDSDFSDHFAKEMDRITSETVRILKQKQGMLRITDIEAAGRIVILCLEEVIHSIALNRSPIEENRILKSLTDMLCRYLFK